MLAALSDEVKMPKAKLYRRGVKRADGGRC